MSTWIIPTAAGIKTLLHAEIVAAVKPIEADGSGDRVTAAIALAVAEVRGTIERGRRLPLSQTAGSVPPEAEPHVYAMAVKTIVATEPELGKFADTETFKAVYRRATDWMDKVGEGAPFTAADDPVAGFEGPTFGDMYGEQVDGVAGHIDMTTT